MSFSYGGQIGSSVNDASSSTTETITVGVGGVPLGALIVIYASKSVTVASITAADTKGNTYTPQLAANEVSDNQTLQLVTANVTSALANGDTITLTYGATFSVKLAQAHYFTSSLSTIAFGTAGSAVSAFPHTTKTTGAVTVGATDELLVAGWLENFAPETWTAGSGYTSLATVNDPNAISSMFAQYNLAAGVTGSTTPSCTVTAGSADVGIGARFTESGSGGGGIVSPLRVSGPSYASHRAASI